MPTLDMRAVATARYDITQMIAIGASADVERQTSGTLHSPTWESPIPNKGPAASESFVELVYVVKLSETAGPLLGMGLCWGGDVFIYIYICTYIFL